MAGALGTPTLPRPDPFSPPLRGALSSASPVTAHWGRTQAPIWLPVVPKEFSGMGHTQAPSSYSVEPSVTAGLGPSSILGEVGMKWWPAGHGGICTQSLEPLPNILADPLQGIGMDGTRGCVFRSQMHFPYKETVGNAGSSAVL